MLAEKEEFDALKVKEEEKRCKKVQEWEYRLEREVNELKRKVLQWEREKEERKLVD